MLHAQEKGELALLVRDKGVEIHELQKQVESMSSRVAEARDLEIQNQQNKVFLNIFRQKYRL